MRVLILHGWGANSQSNWFQWLKTRLENKGVKVYCPNLPDSDYPKMKEWLKVIRDAVGEFNDLVIIGHSLGAVAIPRVLEHLSDDEKIKAGILVSGFVNNVGIEEINDFFKEKVDWAKVKSKADKFYIINSDDDPYIPLKEAELLHKKLGGELIIEKGLGHINAGSGFIEYKRVLDIILSL